MQNLNKISNYKRLSKSNDRSLVIAPFHVGKSFSIHNGKNFQKIFINKKMIGCKFGIFVKTRKTFKFKKN